MLTQIHLINLDRDADRLARFKERNSHLTNVVRCSAVDGSLVDREELMKKSVILDDCPYAKGTLGCALSHIGLWKKAQAENRPMTIFEDDVISSFGFEKKIERLVGSIPADWDIVLWGAILNPQQDWAKVWVDFGCFKASIHCFELTEFDAWSGFQALDAHHSLTRLMNAWGTIAYSVSANGARLLLNSCVPLRKRAIRFSQPDTSYWDEGIDGPMNGAYPSMKAFICIPPLVMHDQSHGAISARKVTDSEA